MATPDRTGSHKRRAPDAIAKPGGRSTPLPKTALDPSTHPTLDIQRFRTLRVLGHGAYAWVEEVRDSEDGQILAMKVLPAPLHRRERVRAQVQQEVDILRKISGHRHIVTLKHSFADARGFCMLVAPVAEWDLSTFCGHCETEQFPERLLRPARMWFSCLAHGLAYIHSHRIRHKDIKPQNILIKDSQVLYADFGLSKDFAELDGLNSVTEGYTPKTPMYAAPEVIEQSQRSYSADIFSLGCVYAELATTLSRRSALSFFEFRAELDEDTGFTTHAFHSTTDLVREWLSRGDLGIRHAIDQMLLEDPLDRPQATELQGLIADTCPELSLCCHTLLDTSPEQSAVEMGSVSPHRSSDSRPDRRDGASQAKSYQNSALRGLRATSGFLNRRTRGNSKVMKPTSQLSFYQHQNLSDESLGLLTQMQLKLNAQESSSQELSADSQLGQSQSLRKGPPVLHKSQLERRKHSTAAEETSEIIANARGHQDSPAHQDVTSNPNGINAQPDYTPSKLEVSTVIPKPESSRRPPPYVLVLIGDGGVGKTALVTSFLFGQVFPEYDPTIEDSYRKQVVINGAPCLLQIIDTGGQDAHAALREQWIADAHGLLVVYSTASRASFDRVPGFADAVRQLRGAGFPARRCTLVGAKADLEDEREVSAEEGAARARELGYAFVETSAVLNLRVRETFLDAAMVMVEPG